MTHSLNAKIAHTHNVTLSDSHHLYNSVDPLPLLVIDNVYCQAVIALQGAQLLSFQPKDGQPWLWLSPLNSFKPGKPIRGGIPVCLPWFGVNQQHPDKPKHGFARNKPWDLLEVTENAQTTEIVLGFNYPAQEPELFTSAFSAQLKISLSGSLETSLTIKNQGPQSERFSWAFHSYLAIQDLGNSFVNGLEQLEYLDNTRNLSTQIQQNSVNFSSEVDRVYPNTSGFQLLDTHHKLCIDGTHCPTCIVWNPGESAAQNIADVKEFYKDYICVERGCAFNDTIALDAGESFTGTMFIHSKKD